MQKKCLLTSVTLSLHLASNVTSLKRNKHVMKYNIGKIHAIYLVLSPGCIVNT